MYIYIYIYTYIYICVYIYKYIHIHMYMSYVRFAGSSKDINICIYTNVFISKYWNIDIHTLGIGKYTIHNYVYTYIYIYTCIHIYIYVYIHIYLYLYSLYLLYVISKIALAGTVDIHVCTYLIRCDRTCDYHLMICDHSCHQNILIY
jgi:hypothetical protein